LQKLAMQLVLAHLGRHQLGDIRVTMPDQSLLHFGNPGTGPAAEITIHRYRFFTRVAAAADVGFGEAYVEGDYDTKDLTTLLSFFVANQHEVDERNLWSTRVGQFFNKITHWMRENTRSGSSKNISFHYDLSNDFFKLMLDPSMLYSSAIFNSPGETLEQGQWNKVHRLLDQLRLKPTDHLLEIGSGWGGLAIEAVRRYGCRVTTITLSKEQLKIVEERASAAGVADRVTAKICDYRDMTGSFDKIVSVEMLEAVGEEYFQSFFAAIERLLAKDGLAAIQVITMPEQRFATYRITTDWIQKYIFPGCLIPSLTSLNHAMAKGSRLYIEDVHNIGIHYARTLREWRLRLAAAQPEVRALGFDDRFLRSWNYYLCYCEAGFSNRVLNDMQLLLTRPGNKNIL